jgi:hypothetical protein
MAAKSAKQRNAIMRNICRISALPPTAIALASLAAIACGSTLLSAGAHAEELAPLAGRSIVVGEMRGIAYYRASISGFEVVVTLAAGAEARPVRFTTTLLPGQATVISAPGKPEQEAATATITRDGDRLLVHDRIVNDSGSLAAVEPGE